MSLTYPERLHEIRSRIHRAALAARRDPSSIQLVAVSKTHPPEAVAPLAAAGQIHFGENRVQEARAKIPLLPSNLQWHLIGHLQKNKIRQALPLFSLIHSVDSLELATNISRIAVEEGITCRCLLEINVAGEATKFGFTPQQIRDCAEEIARLPHLDTEGLMCIPPPVDQPVDARPFFIALRNLRDQLEDLINAPLSTLSMGMSHDFEVAIAEGSTIVRVGTALFGDRNSPPPQET